MWNSPQASCGYTKEKSSSNGSYVGNRIEFSFFFLLSFFFLSSVYTNLPVVSLVYANLDYESTTTFPDLESLLVAHFGV
jgi:hypothetical protein